jgi:L-threonylcarbamoyladenylate synthase
MKASDNITKILRKGGIGVLPTDTIYGLVGLALSEEGVKRIYKVRKRNPKKPLIILISVLSDLEKFKVPLDKKTKTILKDIWPGKVSVILPCAEKRFEYLHRGTKGLAFRLPAKKSLRELIARTGPLVAPSANPEGVLPATSIAEAKNYFGNQVDFYYGSRRLESRPSTLIEVKNGKIKVLRQGAVDIKIN